MDSVIQWFILCQHNMLYSDVSMTLWKASLSWWPVSYQKSAYNLFISWLVFFPRRSVQLCLFNCVILPLLQVLPDRWQNYFWLEDYSRCFLQAVSHKVRVWLWTNPRGITQEGAVLLWTPAECSEWSTCWGGSTGLAKETDLGALCKVP